MRDMKYRGCGKLYYDGYHKRLVVCGNDPKTGERLARDTIMNSQQRVLCLCIRCERCTCMQCGMKTEEFFQKELMSF